MTADTEQGVEHISVAGGGMVDIARMGGRGLFVHMAVQAENLGPGCALIGVDNHIIDMGTGQHHRVDVTGGVVAHGAAA